MKLAELMRKRELSDAALAEKMKCAPSTIYQWRTGVYMPRMEHLRPLCRILECSADDLLDIEVGKPTRLNRAQSVKLYQAITQEGKYNSDTLHNMATLIRKAKGGKTSEFELWLRELAEAVYEIELTAKVQKGPSIDTPGEQLQLAI